MSKLIITKIENKIVTAKYNDFKIERVSVSDCNKKTILDNIYVAKVKNIVKNINAAFVEISNGVICYLDLKEMINPLYLNDKKDDNIVVGDEILVQVIKDVWQKKAPVVTTSFCIKENNVILTHGKNNIGISNKIKDTEKINTLKTIFEPYKNNKYGFIVRTSAKDYNNECLVLEIESLIKEYNKLVNKAKYITCFSCVKSTPDTFICDIKEMIDKSIEEIIIEDDKLYEVALNDIEKLSIQYNINFKHYRDDTLSLSKLYNVESSIADLLKERVWLKSGANIVIQTTEALTVVDVNTSKSIKIKGDKEDTLLKINKEAAKEIAYQLSLRNIGGIIVIDFIDMKRENNKKELLKYLQDYLDLDYVKATVVDMTKLNLVEITRKKVKSPLVSQVGEIKNILMKYM